MSETAGERELRLANEHAAQMEAAEAELRHAGPSVGAMLRDVRDLVERGRYELARDRALMTPHRPEMREGLMDAAAKYRAVARTYDGMAQVLEDVAGELQGVA